MFGSLKKYPKISGYLDRISKIWIMKKIDIQSIQVSMYPKKTDIHVSIYPCIQVSMISKYPIIQVSKKNWYPRYPNIRISKKSGIRPSLDTWHNLSGFRRIQCLSVGFWAPDLSNSYIKVSRYVGLLDLNRTNLTDKLTTYLYTMYIVHI